MAKSTDSDNHNRIIAECSHCGKSALTIYLENGYCRKCRDD
jgi:uncharacterized protein (DUF2237 family)